MKRSWLTLSLIFALIIEGGCNSEHNNHSLTVSMPNIFTDIKEIIDRIELVALENDGNHFLGSRVELLTDSCSWYLVDKENGRIYRYSEQGKFLNSIGERGKGPGEYVRIQDFQLYGDSVVVFSFPEKILFYNKTGVFLGSKTVKGLGENSFLSNSFLLTYRGYRPDSDFRLICFDDSGKKSFLPSKKHVLNLATGDPVFSTMGDHISVIDSYSNTIYTFHNNSLDAFVTFDFGNYNIPDQFFKFSSPYEGAEFLLSTTFARIVRICGNINCWLAEVELQGRDEVERAYCLMSQEDCCWFKLDSSAPLFATFRNYIDGELIALVDSSLISNLSPDLKKKIVNPHVIENSDNYVIAKIRLI